MRAIQGFLIFSLLVLAGCVSIKTDIAKIDKFEQADYQAYTWATMAMKPQVGRSERAVVIDNALRNAVDAQLSAKGYQKVAADQAQFVLDYRFTRKVSVDQGDRMATPAPLQGAFDTRTMAGDPGLDREFVPEKIQETFLRFSVRDGASKKELWHGTASKILEEKVQDKDQISRIAEQLAGRLFKAFPQR